MPLHGSGQYCETVIKTREKLLIPDALADKEWQNSPGVKSGLISYLGFPIVLPDGRVFGTICVLDEKKNSYSKTYEKLIYEFKGLVESHLVLLCMNRTLERKNKELRAQASEIRTLRGIIPICSFCQKVRDDEGFWGAVEEYISAYSNVDFSHSVCPDCAHEHYSEFMDDPDSSDTEKVTQPL